MYILLILLYPINSTDLHILPSRSKNIHQAIFTSPIARAIGTLAWVHQSLSRVMSICFQSESTCGHKSAQLSYKKNTTLGPIFMAVHSFPGMRDTCYRALNELQRLVGLKRRWETFPKRLHEANTEVGDSHYKCRPKDLHSPAR